MAAVRPVRITRAAAAGSRGSRRLPTRRFPVPPGTSPSGMPLPTAPAAISMESAAGAAGSGIPRGLVPGGTGNLLVGNLRLPRDPAAAARVILTGRTAAIDLGSVERADGTHYFAVCGGTGFDARLMAGTGAAEKRRWKMAAYVMRAFAALPTVTSP